MALYDSIFCRQIGLSGGGGEYDVVVGFGWTNGVLLHFLDKYGDILEYNDDMPGAASSLHPRGNLFSVATSVWASILSVLARFWIAPN